MTNEILSEGLELIDQEIIKFELTNNINFSNEYKTACRKELIAQLGNFQNETEKNTINPKIITKTSNILKGMMDTWMPIIDKTISEEILKDRFKIKCYYDDCDNVVHKYQETCDICMRPVVKITASRERGISFFIFFMHITFTLLLFTTIISLLKINIVKYGAICFIIAFFMMIIILHPISKIIRKFAKKWNFI